MKKLIAAALLIVGMTTFAQEKPERKEKGERPQIEKFTPEQRNQLRIKKLTLELDLTSSQQQEMGKILAEADAKREAGRAAHKAQKDSPKKLTADERFARQNKMLDEKIAFKAKVKKVLNADQLSKWEKMQDKRKLAMYREKKQQHPRPEHRG